MALIPGTTIEYEMKNPADVTSAYSYAKFVNCWNKYELGVNDNPVIQWVSPNQRINVTTGDNSNYIDIIWIYDEFNTYTDASVLIPASSVSELPVITKLDIQTYKLVIGDIVIDKATPTGNAFNTQTKPTSYSLQANEYVLSMSYYFTERETVEYPSVLDKIRPVLRANINGDTWYFSPPLFRELYIRNIPNNGNKLDATNPYGTNQPHSESDTLMFNPTGTTFAVTFPSLGHSFYCGGDEDYAIVFDNVNNSTNLLKTEAASIDVVLRTIATMGCYFEYNGTLYLGFMDESGQTTGEYLTEEDWEKSAQWDSDNINNFNEHNPPYVPPIPTEDAEPESFGWGGNEVAGMVRYYLLKQSEMEELQAFMSDASWRMDYRNCIIGMYVVPNGGLFFDAIEPTTLKFSIGLNEQEGVIPQDQRLDTGISCLRISGVVNNESAVIELPRINGNFLDFEPYSKYMVYIPFCGVIPLPDYVAGKEIKVSIFPDVPTCTCTAIVTSEGRKIATAKGAYGSQLPVTSDGDGLKAASVINSLGNIIMGAGEVALGIGTGMVPLAIAGGAQMLSSGLQADLQLGQAFGYSIGASGDTSFFGAGNRCEYYIAYSKWNNPDSDETNIYGHTYGFVCNKRGLLKEFEGFTVCDNPHVHGFSCTSDEKDEIERLLREGIIIHMPEE